MNPDQKVTIDVAALCVKSGNVAILKGGSEAIETNKVKLFKCIRKALQKIILPKEVANFIVDGDRSITNNLLKQSKYIDLVIARGGYDLVKYIQNNSTIPVLAHSAGGARIYIDKSADLDMATEIIVNAKVSKPSACNSVDTVLVHKVISSRLIPLITKALQAKGVCV